MKNIAIAGRMAAGKSTISDYLIEHHGYKRASFAARLKQVASDVYSPGLPIQKGAVYPVTEQFSGRHSEVTGRQLLQRLGQVVKDLDQDFWVRWLLSDLQGQEGPFVLDDLRFHFEADALAQAGWLVVRVDTPEAIRRARYKALYGREPSEAELTHASETGVDGILANLYVDGTTPTADTVHDILDVAEGWCSPHLLTRS